MCILPTKIYSFRKLSLLEPHQRMYTNNQHPPARERAEKENTIYIRDRSLGSSRTASRKVCLCAKSSLSFSLSRGIESGFFPRGCIPDADREREKERESAFIYIRGSALTPTSCDKRVGLYTHIHIYRATIAADYSYMGPARVYTTFRRIPCGNSRLGCFDADALFSLSPSGANWTTMSLR